MGHFGQKLDPLQVRVDFGKHFLFIDPPGQEDFLTPSCLKTRTSFPNSPKWIQLIFSTRDSNSGRVSPRWATATIFFPSAWAARAINKGKSPFPAIRPIGEEPVING